MEWLASNWVWIAVFVGFIALHRFGHGGHGLGGHRHHSRERRNLDPSRTGKELPATGATGTHTAHGPTPAAEGRRQHRHGC